MIEVRVLTPADWALWRRLRLAALADAPAAFGSQLSDWSGEGDAEPRWRARLADVARNVVVVLDGEPVGMVSATAPDEHGAVELISIWVDPPARGRGVGDAAIVAAVQWAHRTHPDSEVVLTVKADNAAAVALYERNGFLDAGPKPGHADLRLMRYRP